MRRGRGCLRRSWLCLLCLGDGGGGDVDEGHLPLRRKG